MYENMSHQHCLNKISKKYELKYNSYPNNQLNN